MAYQIQSLFNDARCYGCAGLSTSQMLQLAMYRQWLLSLDPNADVSFGALMANANCVACYGASMFDMLEISLLNQIAYWTSSQDQAVSSFITRSGITNTTQIAAIKTLVASANSNGWWDKCDLIYPFVGGNATAHAQNLKSPNFTITWAGTVTHDANGITGDGATGYGDTGYVVPTNFVAASSQDVHLSNYRRTKGSGAENCAAAGAFSSNGLMIFQPFQPIPNPDIVRAAAMDTGIISNITNGAVGLNMITRINSATDKVYYAGSTQNSVAQADGAFTTPRELFVLAYNNNGAAAYFANNNIAGVTLGSSITFAEFQVMAADWKTFQTTLGRQV